MENVEPLQVGGAVALAFAAIRLSERAIVSAFASLKVRRNGHASEALSQEVRELKQINVSLVKISETLVVMKTEAKHTLTKVCDNAEKLDRVRSGVNWLKWSQGAQPDGEEG